MSKIMEKEHSGYYLAQDNEISNIDYYIATFSGFNELLKSILRHDPKTRQALLTSSYRELLALRVEAHNTARLMQEIEERHALQATSAEALEAAGHDPLTYD